MTLGDYVINSAVEPLPAYTFGVRKISVHPFFKFTPQADRFDVAVLRLDRPVQYMPHIAPICLPDKGEDFLGHYGWAAGWGALQAGKLMKSQRLHIMSILDRFRGLCGGCVCRTEISNLNQLRFCSFG